MKDTTSQSIIKRDANGRFTREGAKHFGSMGGQASAKARRAKASKELVQSAQEDRLGHSRAVIN